MSRKGSHRNDDAAWNLVVSMIIAICILPFVGIYFLYSGEEGKKVWGYILVVVGIAIWIVMGLVC